ncbi:MAG: hypothetical protein ABSD98_19675 [Candidatus Korobacteraceae bacterium]|jgi:hypothetical protein
MFVDAPNYGPFTSLVGTAGSIVATGAALLLGFRGRARWEPSEEDVSKGPQKVASLLSAVGIVLLWANSRPEQMGALTHLVVWLLGITVAALLVYGLLNATLIYYIEVAVDSQKTEKQKIIGGFWYETGIAQQIRSLRVTVQDFLKGTGYNVDAVWPPLSRGLAKQAFVLAYLLLTVCGTLALASASIITGFKTGH